MKSFKVILALAALAVLSVAVAAPATPAQVAEPEATQASDDIVIRSGCHCNSGTRRRPVFRTSCCH